MSLVFSCPPTVPLMAACDVLDFSRASFYRKRRPFVSVPRLAALRAPNPRRLSDTERAHILDTLHEPEFADQPPTEVYATLLGRGIYLASIRTMYRILSASGEAKSRCRRWI